LPDISQYDFIVGWRADDAYFSFVEDFMLGLLSLENLQKAMKFGDLGKQLCCKSEKAFKRLTFQNAYNVTTPYYYENAKNRDTKARDEYFKLSISEDASRGKLIIDIVGR
jgi:hypothetical protein